MVSLQVRPIGEFLRAITQNDAVSRKGVPFSVKKIQSKYLTPKNPPKSKIGPKTNFKIFGQNAPV